MVLDPQAEPSPGSTSALRTANQRRVITAIRSWPGGTQTTDTPLTQAALARSTGLAPATVSNIVRDLLAEDLIETEPGSGRRGTVVRLSSRAGLVAGVDFGHSHVSVALGDLAGHVRSEQRRRLAHDHAHEDGLTLAASMLEELLAATAEGATLRGVGLGVPAPITDDVVRSSAILPGWVGVNARRAASAYFGVPVEVENDANLGALAEQRVGAARGHRSVAFLKVSSGVGGGLILEDRLFRGADGTAGEIGHLTLDEQGPVCRCGSRGCLETYTSTATVQAMLADQFPDATIDDIVAAARSGNVAALRAFEDAGLHLGWGVASVVNVLNPGLVVLGGDMARAGDLLLDSVRIGLRRHALDTAAATAVVAGQLDERASLAGAVLLAADAVDLAVPA